MNPSGSSTLKYLRGLSAPVLHFSILYIFLASTVWAGETVRIAYISDSPGSSAPYWIAKEAGLNDTLAVQANWDRKAANAKAQEFVDLRFVDQLKKSGFTDKLYGTSHVSRN